MAQRLADVLAGLSRFADLGFGLPPGTSLRSGILAARLADAVDAPTSVAVCAFWTALLQHVGCVGYAHESARLFGDDLVVNAAAGRTDPASPSSLVTTFLPVLTAGRPTPQRIRLALSVVVHVAGWGAAYTTAACEVGSDAARRLGLPGEVQGCLLHAYDVWRDSRGDAIPAGARIARVAGVAALFNSVGGPGLALAAVRERSGGMLDPALTRCFTAVAGDWLVGLASADPRKAALDEEPGTVVLTPGIREVAEVFGDLADLKSPCFVGHSRRVAKLATGAASALGLPTEQQYDLELAGLLHDVGRVAVSNRVWDKPATLSADEWEEVRLHPYHTERILSGSPVLSRLAPLAGRHHERLDRSGYFRGSGASDLSMADRVLAAAECLVTAGEPRPHRAALSPHRAKERLLEEVRRGRLDSDAAAAVLTAAGQTAPPPRRPGMLSKREVEVLRLLAHGASNPEIAAELVISRRTAEHHVQHVYAKIGVSSRAAATLYAVEHRLLDD
jgi:DNA-binding CsgD family transcriptional regulator